VASLGHLAIGMAAGRAFGPDPATARKAAVAFSLVSFWPDVDALGLSHGIAYASAFGHRGATHSIVVAVVVGLLGHAFARRKKLPALRTALFTTAVAMSHGLLDTTTYGGGLGCALLWPFSTHRFWAPVRFIPVAPIGARLFSSHGLTVMSTELLLFAPFFVYALWPRKTVIR